MHGGQAWCHAQLLTRIARCAACRAPVCSSHTHRQPTVRSRVSKPKTSSGAARGLGPAVRMRARDPLCVHARAQSLDTDRSGTVTLEELQAGLAKQGTATTHREVQGLIESLDLDANGSIDYDEFLAATVQMSQSQVRMHVLTDSSGGHPPLRCMHECSRACSEPGGCHGACWKECGETDGGLFWHMDTPLRLSPCMLSCQRLPLEPGLILQLRGV